MVLGRACKVGGSGPKLGGIKGPCLTGGVQRVHADGFCGTGAAAVLSGLVDFGVDARNLGR